MGLVILESGADFMSGENQFVAADYEGVLKLAPEKNLIPDPGLFDFDEETGTHRYWKFLAAPKPDFWQVLMRDTEHVTEFARQTTTPIPIKQSEYLQTDELIRGPGPVDASRASTVAHPDAARATAKNMGVTGLPEGWYTASLGFGVGKPALETPRVTGPGTRTEPFYLSEGQGIEFSLPSSYDKKATAVILYLSIPAPQANGSPEAEAAAKLKAANNEMFEQKRWPVRGAPNRVRLVEYTGPRELLGKNDSGIDPDDMPELKVWIDETEFPHNHYIKVKLGYSFYTRTGMTKSKKREGSIRVEKGRKGIFFMPRRYPKGVIGWRPEVSFIVTTTTIQQSGGVSEASYTEHVVPFAPFEPSPVKHDRLVKTAESPWPSYMGQEIDGEESELFCRLNDLRSEDRPPLSLDDRLTVIAYRTVGGERPTETEPYAGDYIQDIAFTREDSAEEAFSILSKKLSGEERWRGVGIAREADPDGYGYRWSVVYGTEERLRPEAEQTFCEYVDEETGVTHVYGHNENHEHVYKYAIGPDGVKYSDYGAAPSGWDALNGGYSLDYTDRSSYSGPVDRAAGIVHGLGVISCKKGGSAISISNGSLPYGTLGRASSSGTIIFDMSGWPTDSQNRCAIHEFWHLLGFPHAGSSPQHSIMFTPNDGSGVTSPTSFDTTNFRNRFGEARSGGDTNDKPSEQTGGTTTDPESTPEPEPEEVEVEIITQTDASGRYAIETKGGGALRPSQAARVYAGIPNKWPEKAPLQITPIDFYEELDQSEVAAPEEAPAITPIELNSSGLTPGPHFVRCSYAWADGEETLAGPVTKVEVESGQAVQVKKPLFHNMADNPDGDEIDPVKKVPKDWEFNPNETNNQPPNNVRVWRPAGDDAEDDGKRGGCMYRDYSQSASDYVAFKSARSWLDKDIDRFCLIFSGEMFAPPGRACSGRVKLKCQQFDGSGAFLREHDVEIFSGPARSRSVVRLSRRATDVESPSCLKIHDNTRHVRITGVGLGSSVNGVRDFRFDFRGYAVTEGWADARPIRGLDNGSKQLQEDEEAIFPHGGYCVVRESGSASPIVSTSDEVDFLTFESQTFGGWTLTASGSNLVSNIGKDWASTGDYGWKNARTSASTGHQYIAKSFAAGAHKLAFAFDVVVKAASSAHSHVLGRIVAKTGQTMATVFYHAPTSRLQVKTVNASGVESGPVIIGYGVEANDRVSIEMFVEGGNTANGKLYVRVGTNAGSRRAVETLTGISWTGRSPGTVRVGPDTSDSAATWNFWYDKIEVNYVLRESFKPQGGNYIEYYGPRGTRINARYGPTGLKVPAKPGLQYTLSANAYGRDVRENSCALKVRACAHDGEELEVYGYVVKSLTGDTDFSRHTLTITTPPETAYVEFFENRLSEGLVILHGIQLEEGALATAYDWRNKPSGFFKAIVGLVQDELSPHDPVDYLGTISKIRGAQVSATTSSETSVYVTYSPAESPTGPFASEYDDAAQAGRPLWMMVHGRLASANPDRSPELRRITIDVARPDAMLLRADGTEFRGGSIVRNKPGVHTENESNLVKLASGLYANSSTGELGAKWMRGLELEVYRNSVVEEITALWGLNGSLFRIETPERRYTVMFEARPQFTPTGSRVEFDDGRERYRRHKSQAIDAYIVAIEELE